MTDIKEVKNRLGITNEMIAEWFGFKSRNAFQASSQKKRIEAGIVKVVECMDGITEELIEDYGFIEESFYLKPGCDVFVKVCDRFWEHKGDIVSDRHKCNLVVLKVRITDVLRRSFKARILDRSDNVKSNEVFVFEFGSLLNKQTDGRALIKEQGSDVVLFGRPFDKLRVTTTATQTTAGTEEVLNGKVRKS